jgi:ACS family hexuronate transporter-like MFS transporter
MSAASFGYMLSIFPVGWVVDRIGARWPIVTGELFAGISMIALFFVPSYTWLLILMFVTGLGCGFLMPSTTQAVIAWFPPRERATVMGFKQTAVNIGGIISAATLPPVALALGWRYGFLFLGITAIAIGATAFILYREPATAPSNSIRFTDPATAMPLGELFKNREIWLLAFCGLGLTWFEMAMIAHLVLYLTEVLLFGVVAAGGVLAMTEAAGVISKPVTGFLSDRVFSGNRKQVFLLMTATASIMCFLVGLLGPYLSWALYPVLFFLGMVGIGWAGLYLTLLSEFGGRRGAGKAVGLGGMLMLVGATIGPTVYGYIVDISRSYKFAWLSLAFVTALCIVPLLFVREEKKKI